ncbi:MAG TPA: GTP-binding protein [Clostridiaceae bacterium]|nr:GTP-binding protein [Clostridiaceae bacterium]
MLFTGCGQKQAKPDVPDATKNENNEGLDNENGNSDEGQTGNADEGAKDSENGETKSEENGTDGSGTNQGSEEGDNAGTNDSANGSNKGPGAKKKDILVKALYLTGWTVGMKERLDHYIELANTTEINSYVIDIKDDDGLVGYESSIPAVREIGAWTKKYDVDYVISRLHENNIHVIGRIVCFKDPYLSSKRPDLAIKDTRGGLWKEKNSNGKMITWLNPYNKESWPYLIDIAKEAVQKGFDEIQFDYVRFPSGDKTVMDFGTPDKKKYEAINEFLAYARKEMPDVVLSADIFGIVCEGEGDSEDIGQYLELIGKDLEYISPMLYPSHYALGQVVNGIKFAKPDLEPYAVVYNSLAKTKNRFAKVDGYTPDVRPYLQDFTANWIGKGNYIEYGPEQVRQQIQAVYDAGYKEWILWSARNKYSEAGLLKE